MNRQLILEAARQLLLEAAVNCKLKFVELKSNDITNDNKYVKQYIKLYQDKFHTNLKLSEAKKFIEKDHVVLALCDDDVVGFIRYGERSDDKYAEYFNVRRYTSLSDLASKMPGTGKQLIRYMFKHAQAPYITVPWTDDLIKYYQKFGFKKSKPASSRKLPSVLMIKLR